MGGYFYSIFVLLFAFVDGERGASHWYSQGVQAYLENRWENCADHLETAIHMQRQVRRAIGDCRLKCAKEDFAPLHSENVDELHFFEKTVRKTLCFMRCKRIEFPDVVFEFPADADAIKNIEQLQTYKYLQMCYHQLKKYPKAASAAFTYLTRHPDDNTTRATFDSYVKSFDVDVDSVRNFEGEDYFMSYTSGVKAYEAENWEDVIDDMERALREYFEAEDSCRALCEGSFDHGWLPDFTASIANHFTFCLKCKRLCSSKLKVSKSLKGKKILADIYNHLQFAYYHLDQISETAKCVASYLLILPADEDMLYNKKFYSRSVDLVEFYPRREIVNYLNRDRYERKLLKYINKEFVAEVKLLLKEKKSVD